MSSIVLRKEIYDELITAAGEAVQATANEYQADTAERLGKAVLAAKADASDFTDEAREWARENHSDEGREPLRHE
jgi:hypothetical protein